jgi:hypothetical protein
LAAGILLKTITGGEFVDEEWQPATAKQTAKIKRLLSRGKMCLRGFIDLRLTAYLR